MTSTMYSIRKFILNIYSTKLVFMKIISSQNDIFCKNSDSPDSRKTSTTRFLANKNDDHEKYLR